MFCSECGTELKEGAKFCQGCGKQTELSKQDSGTWWVQIIRGFRRNLQSDKHKANQNTGWRMIVGGALLIFLGLYFTIAAAHDISLGGGILGQWWLLENGETLGGLYAYEAGGIVGIILGVVVAIFGISKVIKTG